MTVEEQAPAGVGSEATPGVGAGGDAAPETAPETVAGTPPTTPDEALMDAVLQPVRGRMAFESCVERLGSAIRLGMFPAGTKLPGERELATRLDVSRATLREAMSALRAAGFVATVRGRGGGAVVQHVAAVWPADDPEPLDRRDVEGLLTYRAVVEPGAAYQAAGMALAADRRALLQECVDDVSAAQTPEDYRRADARLHLAIAAVCESDDLTAACTGIQTRIHRLLARIPFLRKNIEGSDEQHRGMVEAILTGDADGAQAIMRAHCDATASLLKGLLT